MKSTKLNNKNIVYSLAGFKVLLSSCDFIHNAISPFFNSHITENGSLYVQIFPDCQKQKSRGLRNEFEEKRKSFTKTRLKAYDLYYDEVTDCYYFVGKNLFGKYERSNDKVVWFIRETAFYPRNIFHICILDILSLSAPKYNCLILHGAVIEYNSEAFLFLGNSGAGKSTITHKLSQEPNINKICDDVFLIKIDNGLCLYPIYSGNGYTLDYANTIINTNQYKKLYKTNTKYYFLDNDTFTSKLLPKHVFLLERISEKNSVQKTSIFLLNPDSLLKLILSRQANVASPFIKERYTLIKNFSSLITAEQVVYSGNCNIVYLLERIINNYG